MNQSYTYKGIPCTIKNRFATGLAQIQVSGEVKTVPYSDIQATGNRIVVLEDRTKKVDTTPTTNAPILESLADITKVSINTLNLNELAALKGIGKLSARKILGNKPEGGYLEMEQLKSLNTELDRLDWDVVASQITF